MIRNQWYIILESKEVPKGRPVGVVRMVEKLVLWRQANGEIACIFDRCPHLGAQLSQGRLCETGIACPFHGFEFAASGECCYIPALGKNGEPPRAMRVNSYPTYEAHGFIWIYWGEGIPARPTPRWIPDVDDSFSYAGYRDHWPVHYSRMVENQLDVVHLPFVHHNTIGRGNRTVIDGPLFSLQDDHLQVWVYNRPDDGTPPRKPEALTPRTEGQHLDFYFPNLWQNYITEDLRVVAAFVPVDEENGMLYLRQYQRFVRTPVLREIVNLLSTFGNRYIANQDKAVVRNQLPKKTDLRMGEKPLPADRVIVAYRRRRKELQEQAGQE